MRRRHLLVATFALVACKKPEHHAGAAELADAAVVAPVATADASTGPHCSGHWTAGEKTCVRVAEWNIEQLAVGGATFGCARYTNGQLSCAGMNDMAQLGRGTRPPPSMDTTFEAAAPVRDLSDVTRIVAGVFHACALVKDGHVWCWGLGTSGETGSGSFGAFPTPTPVADLSDAVDLASGSSHACAVRKNGSVACWGLNDAGQLGDGTLEKRAKAVPVKGVSGVKALALGFQHSCALTAGKTLTCWGLQGTKKGGPKPIPGLANVDLVAANQNDTCVRIAGKVKCWGHAPVTEIPALADAEVLAGGNTTMCGLAKGGAVTCIDTWRLAEPPVKRKFEGRVLAVGGSWACIVRQDGQVDCDDELPTRQWLWML